LIDFVI